MNFIRSNRLHNSRRCCTNVLLVSRRKYRRLRHDTILESSSHPPNELILLRQHRIAVIIVSSKYEFEKCFWFSSGLFLSRSVGSMRFGLSGFLRRTSTPHDSNDNRESLLTSAPPSPLRNVLNFYFFSKKQKLKCKHFIDSHLEIDGSRRRSHTVA